MIIEDGGGSGRWVKVDVNNRIKSFAISQTISDEYVLDGHGYNLNSGIISITGNSESAILYLKNNDDTPLVISNIVYLLGTSLGGTSSENVIIKIIRNPIGGTIISNAVISSPVNRNFGSENTLDVDSYSGVYGDTLTGGTICFYTILSPNERIDMKSGDIVLPKGKSIGVILTPQASNTSMSIQVLFNIYSKV